MIARIAATLLFLCSLSEITRPNDPLPGTTLLTETQPLDEVMVAGIDRFAIAQLAEARKTRPHPNAETRERFREIIGVVDQRVAARAIELIVTDRQPSRIATTDAFTIDRVRWQVLDGVTAEGLWLRPIGDPVARVVAIPDADWTPEMIAGVGPSSTTYAADLAVLGCEVLVPTLINRDHKYSGNPSIERATNLSHREFIYRQGFEVGRHVIGYEVQKVLAAVDYFDAKNQADTNLPIAVVGVSEGGLLALYSAAIDARIDATVVSGYFGDQFDIWRKPIYRNVWKLLTEFGDAELANLIAPRSLFIEASPQIAIVADPPKVDRVIAAPGKLASPERRFVKYEINRARKIFAAIAPDAESDWLVSLPTDPDLPPLPILTSNMLVAHITEQSMKAPLFDSSSQQSIALADGIEIDAEARQKRQVDELVRFTQRILRLSHRERERKFEGIDRGSVEAWQQNANSVREQVYDDLIGRLPDPTMAPNPRTRQIISEPEFTAYDVVLNVYPDVIASGVLLLPTGMTESERRPVVVCQHGLEGTPMSTIGGPDSKDFHYYKAMSVELVKRGFIVYAPQNPYRGKDRFRSLQRKSNPLGRSLFSYIIPQHLVTLRWLASLPNVDRDRIGFYGLSYGGKTAMRVPPMLPPTETEPGYCLSICSADFNEWVFKNASVDVPYSYIWTGEYEIFEWNMAHVANYAELAMLMTPRPFMVERGHDDGVGEDQWVAFEYAKVRRHYNKLGIGDKTEIEFFDGPHTINGQGTYRFLHRHLNWPLSAATR